MHFDAPLRVVPARFVPEATKSKSPRPARDSSAPQIRLNACHAAGSCMPALQLDALSRSVPSSSASAGEDMPSSPAKLFGLHRDRNCADRAFEKQYSR